MAFNKRKRAVKDLPCSSQLKEEAEEEQSVLNEIERLHKLNLRIFTIHVDTDTVINNVSSPLPVQFLWHLYIYLFIYCRITACPFM